MGPEPLSPRLLRALLAATILVAGAYAALWLRLCNLPLQDSANHLARATVMADALFDHGVRFGHVFTVALSATPYVLGDLLLAALVKLTGPSVAGPLWNTLVFFALPASLAYLARCLRLSGLAASTAFLIGCYGGSSWFFLMGFQSFQLVLSLSMVVAGQVIRQCESPSWPRFIAIVAMIMVGYLVHLMMVLFVGAMAGVIALTHPAPLRKRMLATGLPVLVCAALLVPNVLRLSLGSRHVWWPVWKGRRVLEPWIRFYGASDALLIAALSGFACLGLLEWRTIARDDRCRLLVAITGAFFVLWSVEPLHQGYVGFVDVRSLGPMYIGVLLLALVPIDLGSTRRRVLAWTTSACIALVNLLVLAVQLHPLDAKIAMYREMLRMLPEGVTVLPIDDEHSATRRFWPLLHAGSWATTDRGAITPYLFSGSNHAPMEYFRYVNLPNVPAPWSWLDDPPALNCGSIARDFDYVAIVGSLDLGCPNFRIAVESADGSISILKRVGLETGPGGSPSAGRQDFRRRPVLAESTTEVVK